MYVTGTLHSSFQVLVGYIPKFAEIIFWSNIRLSLPILKLK
jgi:hypothetical protein